MQNSRNVHAIMVLEMQFGLGSKFGLIGDAAFALSNRSQSERTDAEICSKFSERSPELETMTRIGYSLWPRCRRACRSSSSGKPIDIRSICKSVPADHQSIPEGTDFQQAMLIKSGGETRRSLLGRRYFTIDRHGKVQNNARPLALKLILLSLPNYSRKFRRRPLFAPWQEWSDPSLEPQQIFVSSASMRRRYHLLTRWNLTPKPSVVRPGGRESGPQNRSFR